jgi:hypothetical protein
MSMAEVQNVRDLTPLFEKMLDEIASSVVEHIRPANYKMQGDGRSSSSSDRK